MSSVLHVLNLGLCTCFNEDFISKAWFQTPSIPQNIYVEIKTFWDPCKTYGRMLCTETLQIYILAFATCIARTWFWCFQQTESTQSTPPAKQNENMQRIYLELPLSLGAHAVNINHIETSTFEPCKPPGSTQDSSIFKFAASTSIHLK